MLKKNRWRVRAWNDDPIETDVDKFFNSKHKAAIFFEKTAGTHEEVVLGRRSKTQSGEIWWRAERMKSSENG